jgi:hypothetical protein
VGEDRMVIDKAGATKSKIVKTKNSKGIKVFKEEEEYEDKE